MRELTHKEMSSRGGKATAKKLGKDGLSERGRRMAEAKKRKYENMPNLPQTI